ncbi:hypothetical protein FISHEDRAFT_55420 [Fistulina hepatica ATCC 64428]|uniref:Uncharacterized protein n=1 Tax=Fistulina hepatica ATCC 64428 TaxID=1128425 RepID=A0A0D7AQI0_9AGAR|nr:hypothetical protein FISHEDRAFT_55420 [Fistulina hepatica ATCC 64428]
MTQNRKDEKTVRTAPFGACIVLMGTLSLHGRPASPIGSLAYNVLGTRQPATSPRLNHDFLADAGKDAEVGAVAPRRRGAKSSAQVKTMPMAADVTANGTRTSTAWQPQKVRRQAGKQRPAETGQSWRDAASCPGPVCKQLDQIDGPESGCNTTTKGRWKSRAGHQKRRGPQENARGRERVTTSRQSPVAGFMSSALSLAMSWSTVIRHPYCLDIHMGIRIYVTNASRGIYTALRVLCPLQNLARPPSLVSRSTTYPEENREWTDHE